MNKRIIKLAPCVILEKIYKNYSECEDCEIKRGVKRYSNNKDKISIQQKLYYEKVEINYYRNKMITGKKETQITKKYLHHMLK